MQTVDKAMKLLEQFSRQQPEIGLSELARMTGFDKAATRRFLVALQNHQFIEQNPETKAYRLGLGFIHLAKVRESTFPLESILHAALDRLSVATSETAHASLLINDKLSTIGVSFPDRGNRAHLDVGQLLPFHATASGCAFLAFSSPERRAALLPEAMDYHTPDTAICPDDLSSLIEEACHRGYARAHGSYCNEITGTAVPIFGTDSQPIGSLAIAAPSSRLTEALKKQIVDSLWAESRQVTQAIGGQMPDSYRSLINQIRDIAA